MGNPVYEGINDEQKTKILELRSVSRAYSQDCRVALEENNWDPIKAYTQLRVDGRLDKMGV